MVELNQNVMKNTQWVSPLIILDHDKVENRSFYLYRTSMPVFDPMYKTPLWSAENLTADRISGAKEPRTDDFQSGSTSSQPAQHH